MPHSRAIASGPTGPVIVNHDLFDTSCRDGARAQSVAWGIVARLLRAVYPIATAKLAERHGATAILLLTLFVVLAFQSIDLASFWPYGVVALSAGLVVRIAAVFLARRGSLYAVDDYVSMSYPNIYLVIVLAEMLDIVMVTQLATWFPCSLWPRLTRSCAATWGVAPKMPGCFHF